MTTKPQRWTGLFLFVAAGWTLAACDLVGDLGDDRDRGGGVGDGTCEVEDCGPAPGFDVACGDGSPSELICQVAADGSCAWQNECPTDDCALEECGPAPGADFLCPDGSAADAVCEPTERDPALCGWQFLCPPQACTVEDCEGPAPLAPNYECSDGTIGGPACLPAPGGCDWTIVACPDDLQCDPEECGAPPEPVDCGDGSTSVTTCTANPDGGCRWVTNECAPLPGECDAEACGVAPGAPNYVCEDGSIAGPACLPIPDDPSSCAWIIRDCA